MKKKVEDLSVRAIKGDPDAVNILFDIAKDCEKNEQYKNAAMAYREMAFACRILASRSREEKAEVEAELVAMTVARTIYARWVRGHPDGMKRLPYPPSGIDREFIRMTVIEELLPDEEFYYVFYFLEDVLTDMGMKFFSPGGSLQRKVCGLLEFVFGLAEARLPYTKFLESTRVRIGLDLVADEIEQRYATKEPSVSDA